MTSPIWVPLNHAQVTSLVPGELIQVIAGPQIAVDPTDPDKLYLVYADTETGGEKDRDVNIYFQMLERGWHYYTDAWRASDRVLVNDDEIAGEQDQMLPAIAVDSEGVIYITFYDDRDFAQDDDDDDAQWNVYITYSLDGGDTWEQNLPVEEEWDLGDTESDPAYDELLDHDVLKPGEYMGLAVFEGLVGQNEVREIWSAFAGISDDDPSQDRKSVIWSSRSYWTSE